MSRRPPSVALPRILLPALLLVGGCATWIDKEPACRFNGYDWSDDLLSNIMAGKGDGTFDYDPEDAPRSNIKGEYDVDSGDYAWSIDYASAYFLTSGEVSGYGTAYHNGNLDVLQATTVTDVLGDMYLINERTLREGCGMTSETWTADNQSDLITRSGTYVADNVYEWAADISGYSYTGSWHENLSRTETIDADDDTYYSQITTKPEGIAEGDIEYSANGYDYAGTTLRRFDGGEEDSLVVKQDGETVALITTNYDYDGSGTETVKYTQGTECTYEVSADGGCSYTCTDGDSGSC